MAFPPKTWLDIAAYTVDDVVQGYREYRMDDPVPGDNHPEGYRWGWFNRRRDCSLASDGFDQVRREYINRTNRLN